MKKICSYSSTQLNYSIPVCRTACIYESEDPVLKGHVFEVSTHNGNTGQEWEFKPFASIQEAQAYALSFIAPSHIACKFVEPN